MNIPIGIGGFLKNCSQPGIGTGSFSNFHTSMILVFESMADFWLVRGRSPNSTCAHSCYCGQYENSGAISPPPPSISPLPCFFSPCHVLHHNLPCYEYQGPRDMPGSMCQVSCSMLHSPSTPNVYDMDPKHVWKCQGEKRV